MGSTTKNSTGSKLRNLLYFTAIIGAILIIIGSFLTWNDMISISFGKLHADGIKSAAGQQTLVAGIAVGLLAVLDKIFWKHNKKFTNIFRLLISVIAAATLAIATYQWFNFRNGSSYAVHTSPGIGLYLVITGALLACVAQFVLLHKSGQKLHVYLLIGLLVFAISGGAYQSHRYLKINDPNGIDDDNTGPMPAADQSNQADVITDKN